MNWKLRASMTPGDNILFRIVAKLRSKLVNPRIKSYKGIPIIINNFNRLDYLKQMLSWLDDAGYKKIYIIDNASTYPPLLEFYKGTKYTIFKLDKNVGHLALWQTHIFLFFQNTYYVYTDPDILPVDECPVNVLEYYKKILEENNVFTKVGFGLKIDDIPDYNPRKREVIEWESSFWKDEIKPGLYKAKIDTTFALYKPNKLYQQWNSTLRTGDKYVARHLPWYENPDELSEEDVFFRNATTNVSSWYKQHEEKYNG